MITSEKFEFEKIVSASANQFIFANQSILPVYFKLVKATRYSSVINFENIFR